MKFFFNTISRQLFFAFGFLVAGIILVFVLALAFITKLNDVRQVQNKLNQHSVLVLNLIRTDQDYCRFEVINDDYFRTGNSKFLGRRTEILSMLDSNFKQVEERFLHLEMRSSEQLETIRTKTVEYNAIFDSLKSSIVKKGFRDFGLEGLMRQQAHMLEHDPAIPLNEVLMLRRHEKDFLLRRDPAYVISFNKLIEKNLGSGLPGKTVNNLNAYKFYFGQLAMLQNHIGNDLNKGFTADFSSKGDELAIAMESVAGEATAEADRIIFDAGLLFSAIAIVTTLLGLGLIYITSIRLTRPILRLSSYINKTMENQGLTEKDFETDGINEIQNLSLSFVRLIKKVRQQVSEIGEKSAQLTRQNLELKRVNEELDKFIYSAAHDLKSPLTSLDGLVRLAEREINSLEHAEYFERIHDSIQRLYKFIRDITDYARNKRQSLNVEDIDIVAMVEEIVESLRHLPNGHLINVDIANRTERLFSDRTRLEIILKNIIGNAFHYMDSTKSYSFLKIKIEQRDKIYIVITDNGVGIRRESLPLIFDMFYRAVENSKGTGIGLYLVKEATKTLGGQITVKSILSQWTRFEIALPLVEPVTDEMEETIVIEELV
jgi:signal transduction histidine kinase